MISSFCLHYTYDDDVSGQETRYQRCQFFPDHPGDCSFVGMCEAKHPDRPWVFCTEPHHHPGGTHSIRGAESPMPREHLHDEVYISRLEGGSVDHWFTLEVPAFSTPEEADEWLEAHHV